MRPGEAHGVERRFGATGDVSHLLCAGHGVDDGFGQFDPGLVHGEKGGPLRQLLLDGRDDLRVGMPHQHGAGSQDEVDVLPTLAVPHPTAATGLDGQIAAQVSETRGGQDPGGAFL